MWVYCQDTGGLYHDEVKAGIGYSGAKPSAKNNFQDGFNKPEMQEVHNVGPVPCGDYDIIGPPADTVKHGPYVLTLAPRPNTNTFGRSEFRIHGDSIAEPGTASEGCMIMNKMLRMRLWESGDRWLRVVVSET